MFLNYLTKELQQLLYNYKTYLFLGIFLAFQSYFFFNLLGSYNLEIERIMASSKYYSENNISIYSWVIKKHVSSLNFLLIFIGPFFSVFSFASEFQQGTFQFLKFSKLSSTKIILAKFLCYSLILIALLILSQIASFLIINDYSLNLNVFISALLSNIFFIFVIIASGIFFSLYTKNALSATLINIIFLMVLYMLHTPGELVSSLSFLSNFSLLSQSESLIKGLIKINSLIYFISLPSLFLILSKIIFNNSFYKK